MLNTSRIPALVLIGRHAKTLSYYDDWLEAFQRSKDFDVAVANVEDPKTIKSVRSQIERAPLVICLHSTNADGIRPLLAVRTALANRRGQLVVFVGNEVNLPLAPMAEKIDFLNTVSTDVVATQLLQEAGEWLYQTVPSAEVVSIPHGLNPAVYTPGPLLTDRDIDIGSLTANYGPHIGDNERHLLYQYFIDNAEHLGLRADLKIGTGRLERADWASFLRSCKATIATEAGTAYLERDDVLMHNVQKLVKQYRNKLIVLRDDSRSLRLAHLLLPGVIRRTIRKMLGRRLAFDANLYEGLSLADLNACREQVFNNVEPNAVHTKAVSSRHFEAAGTKTVQILTRGRYNDILRPDEHYIPVRADLSDIEFALKKLHDLEFCQRMVDETHDYVISEHTFDHRVRTLANIMQSRVN